MSKATETLEKLLASTDEYVQLNAARLLQMTDLEQQRINSEWAMRDRTLKMEEAQARDEVNGQEIDRLAQFILEEVPDAMNPSEGAVDIAIRLIRSTINS